MAILDLDETKNNNGKCYIAVGNDKAVGCEYIFVDVFAYNENAIKFYNKNGYHSRMHINIKKI